MKFNDINIKYKTKNISDLLSFANGLDSTWWMWKHWKQSPCGNTYV